MLIAVRANVVILLLEIWANVLRPIKLDFRIVQTLLSYAGDPLLILRPQFRILGEIKRQMWNRHSLLLPVRLEEN